ncbi:MAG: hypothetical protein JEZ02_18660 [Desulfatibacillum sp.]|nr:hypothetical protein [Desulfatibacillum sp.]
MPEFEEIFQPDTEAESDVVRSFLLAEGIETFVTPQGRERAHVRQRRDKRLPSIWVEAEKADLAREVIAAYMTETPVSEDQWAAEPQSPGSLLQRIRNLISRIISGA